MRDSLAEFSHGFLIHGNYLASFFFTLSCIHLLKGGTMFKYAHLLSSALIFVFLAGSQFSCKRKQVQGHSHGSEALENSHESGSSGYQHLLCAKGEEFFVECPVLVVGEKANFAAHLTALDKFKPITEGQVEIVLAMGNKEEIFRAGVSSTPGIFNVEVVPNAPGEARIYLVHKRAKDEVTLDLGLCRIHPDKTSAEQEDVPDAPEGIAFSKEQQWKMDFGATETVMMSMFAGFEAFGAVQAAPGGEARILAPLAGRLEGRFPGIGENVKKGQKLGVLVPRAGSDDTALGTVQMDLEKARLRREQALADLHRYKKLFENQILSKQRLEEAEKELAASESELNIHQSRMKEITTGQGGMGFALTSPISGIVSAVHGGSGVQVTQGQELFYVVDPQRLRLEVQVPESRASSLQTLASVLFTHPDGSKLLLEAGKNARVLGAGAAVNGAWKTVPLLLEFNNPSGLLKVGNTGPAFVRVGKASPGLAVPLSALQDEDGMNVVYVQVGGETFQRRIVRIGPKDGAFVQILDGVKEGEKVVHIGAHVVRLAASAGKVPQHGHAH